MVVTAVPWGTLGGWERSAAPRGELSREAKQRASEANIWTVSRLC